MNKEELKHKLNQAKIDYMTTTSKYRKRDLEKYIKRLEREIKKCN